MAAKPVFRLESIHKVGTLSDDFDAQIAAAVRDCRARPGVATPREVAVVVKLRPNKKDPDDVEMLSHVKTKSPVREQLPYLMQTNSKGEARFSPSSPMDPNQDGMFDGQE